MAYVTGFDQDIFISYAQVDNTPTDRNGKEVRWVSYFKDQLQKRVDQKLGRIGAAKIWMDLDDLGGNRSVTPTIDTAIHKTAALVVVLSDGYLSSMWCQKEVRSFVEAARGEDRLFVVHLADIPLELRPEGIRDLIGFNFFDREQKTEVDPAGPEFGKQVANLRERLASKLADMKKSATPASLEKDADHPVPGVFLAEGHDDLDEHREELRIYIEKLGHRVLPEKLYPRGAPEFQAALDRDLAGCKLFVQLLGQAGTRRTEDFPDGYEGLQLGRATAAKIPLIRAFERGTVDFNTVRHPSHRAMLEAHDVQALDLEEFKVAIKDKLDEIALREAKPAVSDNDNQSVLIHTLGDDQGAAFQICNRLKSQNIAYDLYDETDPIEEVAKIKDYAGLILVYGAKSEGKWIKQRMQVLMNLRLTQKPREPACALYFDPPEKRQQMWTSPPKFFHEIDSNFSEAEFQKFIAGVKVRTTTS